MSQEQEWYDEVARQAKVAEDGSLAKERAVLLLWFLRNAVGVGELEAYDYICDGDADLGIDALFLHEREGENKPSILTIYQSKYTTSPRGRVKVTDIDRLHAAASYFHDAVALNQLLQPPVGRELVEVVNNLRLPQLLDDNSTSITTRLALVTTGKLNKEARQKIEALQQANGHDYISVWDLERIGPMAQAVRNPDRIEQTVRVRSTTQPIIVGTAPRRVAIMPMTAAQVTNWPGIESRQLFALNVRNELRPNRVSRAIDDAIRHRSEHSDFLAYHNGLTIVCDSFEVRDSEILIHRPSVVNGAQSVLAFRRSSAAGTLSEDIQVVVKIVEVKSDPEVEREVARRSNTQTGVNPRNLMANHGPQLRLVREFEEHYPAITYSTKPDTLKAQTAHTISNDDAAQLLCAIINERPWLAIKKTSLFESDNHAQIFSSNIGAHHIVFVDLVNNKVHASRDEFPVRYRSNWSLTRLIACYLVGQIIRHVHPDLDLEMATEEQLSNPKFVVELDIYVVAAAETLHERHDEAEATENVEDDFRKDFKNEGKLRELSVKARAAYRRAQRAEKREKAKRENP